MPRLTVILLLATACLCLRAFSPRASAGQTPEPSISGTVWRDANGDGVRQPSESGIAAAEIELLPQGGAPADAEIVRADGDGRYAFTGLAPGQYQLRVGFGPQGMWFQTHPSRDLQAVNPPPVDVLLGSGPLTSVDFGLYPMAGVPTFGGGVWKYAQELPDTLAPAIRALIDGVDCTMPALRPPGVTYRIRVAPALLVLGCGVLGATIRFTVNGELANETAVWQRDSAAELPPTFGPTLLSPPGVVPPEGAGNRFLELTVGPPFAVYRGEMSRIKDGRLVPVTSEEEVAVEAFIDGVLCGTGGNLTRLGSDVVVLSEALRPGCGRPDAVVRFFVNGAPVEDEDGNLASRETTVWEPGFHRKHFVFREAADSAPVPSRGLISPPDTGDAGLR